MTRAWPLKPKAQSEGVISAVSQILLTLGTTVNQRLQALRVLRVDQVHQGRVHPPTRLDGVKTTNNEVELHVEVVVLVLDLPVEPIRCQYVVCLLWN